MCGYVDSDFASDLDKRRGYDFTLVGGSISWMSKIQATIAQSTTEVEYMVISHACKKAIWLKGFLGEFGKV